MKRIIKTLITSGSIRTNICSIPFYSQLRLTHRTKYGWYSIRFLCLLCLQTHLFTAYIKTLNFRLRYQVFPSITAAEEITDPDSDSEVDTKKKRYRKEKIGFRDRKVLKYCH